MEPRIMKPKISMAKLKNKRKTYFLKVMLKNNNLVMWADLEGNKFAFKFWFCSIEEITLIEPVHFKLAKKIYNKYLRRVNNE